MRALVGARLVSSALVAYYIYFSQSIREKKAYDYEVAGYTILAGNGSASDGRVSITVHNYRFERGGDITFQYPLGVNGTIPIGTYTNGGRYAYGAGIDQGQVILLVNATVTNVGSGDTSLGGGFFCRDHQRSNPN